MERKGANEVKKTLLDKAGTPNIDIAISSTIAVVLIDISEELTLIRKALEESNRFKE